MLTLSIRDKNGEERVLEFDKEEVTIGRTQGSDIVLPRNNISKRHARLVDKDDKVVIVDLRSTNGTYVNGRRITAPEILTGDDKVYIGDFVIRLQIGAASDATASDAAGRPPQMTRPGPPPGPVSDGPTEGSDAPLEATVAVAAVDDAPRVAQTIAAMPPVMESPPAAPPAEAPPAVEEPPAPAPAAEPAQPPPAEEAVAMPAADEVEAVLDFEDEPAAEAAAAPEAEPAPAPAPAPVNVTAVDLGPAIEAIKKRLFSAIGGERGAANIVRDCKWSGLQSQIAKAAEQARAAGEISGAEDNATLGDALLASLLGAGPVLDLIAEEGVHSVHVNAFDRIIVVRDGGAELSQKTYPSPAMLAHSVRVLGSEMGQDPDMLGPVFDGTLPSGIAIGVVGSPVSGPSPLVIARKARAQAVTCAELVKQGGLTENQLTYLAQAVTDRKNVLIAGRSGSGRTTIANALGYLIPSTERIALVEKVRSIKLPHDNTIHLDRDGIDAVGADIADLLPRLLADRAILDELSGAEIYEFVALANGGADGLMAVMQGSSAERLLSRMALQLELIAGSHLASSRTMVAEAVDVVVMVSREDGKSRVTELVSVETGADGFHVQSVEG